MGVVFAETIGYRSKSNVGTLTERRKKQMSIKDTKYGRVRRFSS